MKKTKKPSPKNKKPAKRPKVKLAKVINFSRFFPAIAISLLATFLSVAPIITGRSGNQGVLAYATNVSISGLLSATNSERTGNGVAALTGSSKLNNAAQAKANDMVARDYWSHQTPDGQQPWVFITNAGYEYVAAGENLAYGFMTSSETVTGWMNSPPHKANLLSGTFTEVGFGFANSPNYVGDGQQTVVVAMYAKPKLASSTSGGGSTAPASTPKKSTPVPTPAPAPAPIPEPEPTPEPVPEPVPEEEPIAFAPAEAEKFVVQAAPANVSRVQIMTGGNAAWSTTAVIMAVCSAGILWLLHKGFRLTRYILASEQFVIHHLHLDLTVLSIVYLGFVLLNNTGVVR